MNVLNKLTLRSLKLNKKRTIVTIIGIILSCALISGITTLIASFQQFMVEEAKISGGDYHLLVNSVDDNQINMVKNNAKIEKYGLFSNLGFANLEKSKNDYKPYINLVGFDENMFNIYKMDIIEGRLPENENEVVISEHIINNADVPLKVGDTLELNLGNRYKIDKITNKKEVIKNNIYYQDDDKTREELVTTDKKTYKIVGIIERPDFEDYSAAGYTVVTYEDDTTKQLNTTKFSNIYITMKKANEVYDFSKILKQNYGENLDIKYNNELLRYEGVSNNNNIMSFLYGIGAFLIGIIMFASISVIRNSFNISIVERLRQFGMLSSIGATSKQIKNSLIFEGSIIGLISIPIGIISGILGIGVTLIFVNNLLKNLGATADLNVIISLPAILLAMLVIIITIYISVRKPAKRASKISPMEAIISSKDIAISRKNIKISKISKKIFGIEGEVALKNLKRSKKKYRTTVFSIMVSIVIFISFSSFVTYGLKTSSSMYKNIDYNIVVNYNTGDKEKLNEIYNKIISMEGIKKYSNVRSEYDLLGKEFVSEEYKSTFPNIIENMTENEDSMKMPINIYSLGKEEYERYIKKIGGRVEDYKDKAILINKNKVSYEGKLYNTISLDIKENETLKILNRDIIVAKVTEELPMNISDYTRMGADVIISDELMDTIKEEQEYIETYFSLYIKANNSTALETKIIQLDSSLRSSVINIEKQSLRENSMIAIASIFFYGFIVLISLIGITNIFNTVTTNMALRSTEFAIFRSIGMTGKEFKKMINYESIFYGIKALALGIPIGIIMSYVVRILFNNIINTSFVFPWEATIISIIFVFAIIFVTMGYSASKIKKQNIIETIRNENI